MRITWACLVVCSLVHCFIKYWPFQVIWQILNLVLRLNIRKEAVTIANACKVGVHVLPFS